MGRALLARWHVFTATTAESEAGASILEYALLGLLIAVVAAIAVQIVGDAASETFEEYVARVNGDI